MQSTPCSMLRPAVLPAHGFNTGSAAGKNGMATGVNKPSGILQLCPAVYKELQMNIACHIRNDALFEQVQGSLALTGLKCERFASETALLRALRHRSFGAIVVDIGAGLQDQQSIFTWLNCRSDDDTPVVVISPVYSSHLLAMTLAAGADDFLARSFEPVELNARINALMRRCNRSNVRRFIELGGYVLDREASSIAYRGVPIEVTSREFTIAWLFFSSPGVYVSRHRTACLQAEKEAADGSGTRRAHPYRLHERLSP
jgi:DNA-binding response OmpR family regulator